MKTPFNAATRYAVIIFLGFALVISIMMLITNLGLRGLGSVNQQLESLVRENNGKMRLMHRMRDVIRERMLNVYNITHQRDPFLIEAEWEAFSRYAGEFIQAREALYALGLSDEQYLQIESQKNELVQSGSLLSQVINLVRQEQREAAEDLLVQAREKNNQVLDELLIMIEHQQAIANQAVVEATREYDAVRGQMIVLNVVAVLVCLIVVLLIVRRIFNQQKTLDRTAMALRDSNAQLEARVKERTVELVNARNVAQEASRTKSRFLANMSHELRTPLNAIIGYAEILMEDAEDDGNQAIQDDLHKILGAGRHLLDLISDVLDISRIETGKITIEPELFNLRALVDEVVSIMGSMVEQRKNRFHVECDAEVGEMYADQTRIRQVLFNLLTNANKFTEAGDITLVVRREICEERPWISCQVRDTGIGISPEQQKKLFKPFMQVDASSTRKYGGTGLGLVISLRFCQLMGGTIRVQSELGKGCVFTVVLPEKVEIQRETPDFESDQHLLCLERRENEHESG